MLGRGLESLIPQKHQQPDEPARPTPVVTASAIPQKLEGPIFHIETDKIKPNPHQPRKHFDEAALNDLAASIREFGIMQPLVVSKVEMPTEHGVAVEYQLIAGERRLLAAKLVGLPRVPVVVRAVPEEREKLELAIVENLQRENLNAIETARAYAKLQDHFGLTQREVAMRLGKSREVVGNAVRLLNLPTSIQDAIAKNQLSESQGRLLLAVSEPAQQQSLFNDIMRNNMSVRELRSRVERMSRRGASIAPTATVDPELQSVEAELQEALGTKVKLQKQGDAGKILIDFYSMDELRNLIQKLKAEERPAVFPDESHERTTNFTV